MTPLSESEIEGWNQNRKLVLDRLDRVTRAVESLDTKVGSELTGMKVEIATIKIKVAAIVLVASTVLSAVISAIVSYLGKR